MRGRLLHPLLRHGHFHHERSRVTQWKFVVVSLLLFVLSPSLAGQDSSLPSGSPPAASSGSWNELDRLLEELSNEALLLSDDSTRQRDLLVSAQAKLSELSLLLERSQTEASGLSLSLRQSEESLQTSVRSVNSLLDRNKLELWLWRGATAVSFVLTLVALLR